MQIVVADGDSWGVDSDFDDNDSRIDVVIDVAIASNLHRCTSSETHSISDCNENTNDSIPTIVDVDQAQNYEESQVTCYDEDLL